MSNLFDEICKCVIYDSFMAPNFNYYLINQTFCGKVSSDKMEKFQFRDLKYDSYIPDAEYNGLLKRAKMKMLLISRIHKLAIKAL